MDDYTTFLAWVFQPAAMYAYTAMVILCQFTRWVTRELAPPGE